MNLKDRFPAPLALLLLGASAYSHAATPIACNALLNQTIEGATITSAVLNVATATLPEHCEVLGSIGQHTGADGQSYAVKFHLRMPTSWSERFYYQGGGGLDGSVGGADAAQINQGYAVVSTDSGHDAATNISAVAGNAEFGFDPQARLDYGYDGPARVVQAAKAITRTYYRQKIRYAYFEGCSEGGREGLMFSQRYPDLFDGVIAGNPGIDLPKAAVAEAWDTQAFASAARSLTPFGFPDLATSFTAAELSAIGDAILKECDAKDGLVDGIISNPHACRFDPRTLGPQGSGLLSASQVTALRNVFDGARDSKGRALYAGWFWDPGIAAPGWRLWKIGPLFPGPGNTSLNTTLGGSALPFVFTTPPNSKTAGRPGYAGTVITTAGPAPSLPGLNDAFMPWLLSFNMDADAPKIYARSGIYSQSAMDFMGTSSTDYRRFRAGGSKLIVYSGQADPVFSSKYHIGWYRDLIDRTGGVRDTQQFARLFVVPGMNHCGGGYATSQFDAFSALVKWVEKGQGPSALIGTAPADTPWPGRTRPICAYPAQPRYTGHGSIEDAANFVCVAVRDDNDDDGDHNGNGPGHGNDNNNHQ
ncbi:tannase/feruloyl esterase family alpha/beta hydrolase [Variovorax sp. Sphag1AA]|uniref:tannase/feruloyl esterase family alpha/beta hydrolase n=1 Tax=Variovorax sp. Sphag1AA TaxID=2587027 RepID=UPI00161C8E01|nr:tannase/feruloyl esterase family alpha/beta hydrolase [Variovorax sp. Sphag1AA]MBB3175836.1 feruloyl esterase [Variovorax sp. Sphag1AA]